MIFFVIEINTYIITCNVIQFGKGSIQKVIFTEFDIYPQAPQNLIMKNLTVLLASVFVCWAQVSECVFKSSETYTRKQLGQPFSPLNPILSFNMIRVVHPSQEHLTVLSPYPNMSPTYRNLFIFLLDIFSGLFFTGS